MTDEQMATFLGIPADEPKRMAVVKALKPEKRAVYERMANLEMELKLWQDGLGPRPSDVLIDFPRKVFR